MVTEANTKGSDKQPVRILTFDIEDWFHILDHEETETESQWESYEARIENNCRRILQFLGERNQLATFFVLGWVARKYPRLVREIADAGHEIGSHSDLHKLVYNQTWSEFRADLKASIASIEDTIGRKIRSYRAPGFSVVRDLPVFVDALLHNGIEIDCSVFPARRAHGGVASFPLSRPCLLSGTDGVIKEFPMSTHEMLGRKLVYSGGGYFRLHPYWAIQRMSENSEYVMTYFHPRDFDVDQPVVPGLSPLRRFKSYFGLKNALPKLDRWLAKVPMTSLNFAADQIDWARAPNVNLAPKAVVTATDT